MSKNRKQRPELPIGTRVVMHDCLEADIHKDKTWVTRSMPWKLGSGEWVVLLEGYRACGFLVDKLKAEVGQ